jgi:Tfp pilus assembly protein PilX
MKIKFRRIRRQFKFRKHGQKGQALVIVLVILLLVTVIATASLGLIEESLKTNQTYANNTISTYSAEAGIQDAIAKIQNDSSNDLNKFFTNPQPVLPGNDNGVTPAYIANTPNPSYNDYDYTDRWAYVLPNSPVPTTLANGTTTTTSVNNQTVNVFMQNIWIPVGITAPSQTTVTQLQANNELTVSGAGTAGNGFSFTVSVVNHGTIDSIPLTSIGIWLPQGFSYVPNSSNLGANLPTGGTFTEQVLPDAGNVAVVYSLANCSLAAGTSLSFTFQFSTNTGNYPTALSWVTDTPVSSFPFSYTWDFSTKVHLLTADAGDTVIQCYSPKSETILPAGESGDYYATGSAAITSINNTAYKDYLLNSSSASTQSVIPSNSQVNAAYLYWTGWVQNYANGIFSDQCAVQPGTTGTIDGVSVPSYWIPTGTWSVGNNGQQGNYQYYNTYFQSTGPSGLTLKNNIDLSARTSVTISWMQDESGTNTVTLQLGANSSFSSPITDNNLSSSGWTQFTQNISTTTYAQYLSSGFNMIITHTGSGTLYLDDINIVDNTITTHYDPSVTFAVTNSSNNTATFTVTPTGQNSIAWSAPVSSARTGNLTFSNGSTTITGTVNGPNQSPGGVLVNNYIRSAADANTWYQVTNVTGNSITISQPYAGTTNTSSYYIQDGYYYACKADVTVDVQQGSTIVSPAITGNGNGNYTVSNLFGNTESAQYPTSSTQSLNGNPSGLLGDSAFAGWSLIIVYANASTLGHQLYLYDFETSVPNQGPNNTPYVINETLNGFIVPYILPTETSSSDVAKLTAFVGEGDQQLTGDYLAYVDSSGGEHQLWDGINCTGNTGSGYNTPTGNVDAIPDNVWNSAWIDQATMQPAAVPGIDIDTFHIEWGENLIHTNDTSATIRLSTNGDGYVLVYMIMSFRSLVTNGGSISYLITRKPQN